MELTLRFDEILDLSAALAQLLDRKSSSPEFAVRVAQAALAVESVAQTIHEQRNTLLRETAIKDQDGEPVYEDAEKTRFVVTPLMRSKVQELLDGTTTLTLPTLPLKAFLADTDGFPLSVYVGVQALIKETFALHSVSMPRIQYMEAVRAIGEMMDCTFVTPRTAACLADMRHRLLAQVRADDLLRLGLAAQYAHKDAGGKIIYSDDSHTDFEVEREGIQAIQTFNQDRVEIDVPVLGAGDLRLRDGGELSPREMLGLLPLISLDEDDA